MTNDEFATFAKRLFVAFPSLWEWLQGTPDARATQEVWRETLRAYSLAECLRVVGDWSSGERLAFEAYERDKVHLLVRAICAQRRDRERKKTFVAETVEERRGSAFDVPGVWEAYRRGMAIYQEFREGRISEEERQRKCREVVESVL